MCYINQLFLLEDFKIFTLDFQNMKNFYLKISPV